jgi:hypothetical protein
MTFSGKCWRRRRVVLAIVTSLLGGCGTAGSDRPTAMACPPVVGYGELQAQAAAEVGGLPAGSAVAGRLSDYAVMRDQARAWAHAAADLAAGSGGIRAWVARIPRGNPML